MATYELIESLITRLEMEIRGELMFDQLTDKEKTKINCLLQAGSFIRKAKL